MGSQFSILSQMANTFVKTVYFALFTLAYFTVEISGDERGIRSMKYYNTNFYVSVTGSGCSDWVMYNGGSEDCIQIRKFRISHHSDRYRKNKNYGGIIVYDWGRYPGIRGGTLGSPGLNSGHSVESVVVPADKTANIA